MSRIKQRRKIKTLITVFVVFEVTAIIITVSILSHNDYEFTYEGEDFELYVSPQQAADTVQQEESLDEQNIYYDYPIP